MQVAVTVVEGGRAVFAAERSVAESMRGGGGRTAEQRQDIDPQDFGRGFDNNRQACQSEIDLPRGDRKDQVAGKHRRPN